MKRLCWIALAMTCGVAPAAAQTFPSSAGNLSVETIASGLTNPWALAFLPDGRMLVTERPGRLRIVGRDGKLAPAVAGVLVLGGAVALAVAVIGIAGGS